MYTFKSGTLKLIVHQKLNHILNLKLNLNLKITLLLYQRIFIYLSLNSEQEIISSLLRPAVGKISRIMIENVTSVN